LSSAAVELARREERRNVSKLFSSPEKRTFVLCLILVAVTLIIYNPVAKNGFINYDDPQYITNNPAVPGGLTWKTIRWSFTNYYDANWHPLTWLSHALDYQLFGPKPAGHHYVSALFHALDAVLLFLLFQSATGFTWRSLMLALLFALHPVNVESVAWAAERKNLLSMLFFLLALQAYTWYARKPAVKRYLLVVLFFALGLMCKPQIITFPFLLLLWDYWPLGRYGANGWNNSGVERAPARSLRWLLLEKCPLLVLSCISAGVTVATQWAGHAIHDPAIYTRRLRFGNAILSYSRYLKNAVWPTRLSPLYPHPLESLRMWQVWLSALCVTAITLLVLRYRRHRYLPVGWLWFLGSLVPMLGLIQVGEQAMADRYAYHSFIGLFIIACWGVAEWSQARKISHTALAIVSILVISALSFLTYRQIGRWRDSVTLWSYALSLGFERPYIIHLELGNALDQEGRFDDAIPQLRAAVDPRHHAADELVHLGFGIYDQKHGHIQEAITEYEIALHMTAEPTTRAAAYSDLGSAYRELRDDELARKNFTAALQIDPNQTMALVGMGLLMQKSGDLTAAIQYYTRAMSVQPTDVGYILLAQAQYRAGDRADAEAAVASGSKLSSDLNAARQTAANLLSY
jgi:protein O-mannosyl-transferase